MPLTRLVSGGQTGVDRGALDAALAGGFPCGGWCPAGRLAEDGVIAAHYPLTELEGATYLDRTIRNVVDSDATLIVYFDEVYGGTEQTLLHCIDRRKPCKLIDATEIVSTRAAALTRAFVERHGVSVLNVAGPRASDAPLAYAYAFDTIAALLRLISARSRHP
jgi:hypothetical protein